MIFGFNTDVQLGDVVYHVQSEARQADLLLQTQVFVGGRCLGKRGTSYARLTLDPGFNEQQVHELLKEQHRAMLELVHSGAIDRLSNDADIHDVAGNGLALRWLNPENGSGAAELRLRLLITDAGTPAPGAVLSYRAFSLPNEAASEAENSSPGVANHEGEAELLVACEPLPAAILVEARHGEKSAMRKLRLRR